MRACGRRAAPAVAQRSSLRNAHRRIPNYDEAKTQEQLRSAEGYSFRLTMRSRHINYIVTVRARERAGGMLVTLDRPCGSALAQARIQDERKDPNAEEDGKTTKVFHSACRAPPRSARPAPPRPAPPLRPRPALLQACSRDVRGAVRYGPESTGTKPRRTRRPSVQERAHGRRPSTSPSTAGRKELRTMVDESHRRSITITAPTPSRALSGPPLANGQQLMSALVEQDELAKPTPAPAGQAASAEQPTGGMVPAESDQTISSVKSGSTDSYPLLGGSPESSSRPVAAAKAQPAAPAGAAGKVTAQKRRVSVAETPQIVSIPEPADDEPAAERKAEQPARRSSVPPKKAESDGSDQRPPSGGRKRFHRTADSAVADGCERPRARLAGECSLTLCDVCACACLDRSALSPPLAVEPARARALRLSVKLEGRLHRAVH